MYVFLDLHTKKTLFTFNSSCMKLGKKLKSYISIASKLRVLVCVVFHMTNGKMQNITSQ